MSIQGWFYRVGVNPSQLVKTTNVLIPFAAVRTLRATPVVLVPAKGANRYIEFLGGVIRLRHGGVAYTETADNLVVRFTNTTGVVVSAVIEMTGFITLTSNAMTRMLPVIDPIATTAASLNQALVLHNNGDGEFANSGTGALEVWTSYRVWDVT